MEPLHHKPGDDLAQGRGNQTLVLLFHILPILNGGNGSGVGGRTAYPLFLHGLDQGGLGIPGGRLGEVLSLLRFGSGGLVAGGQVRQGRTHGLAVVVPAFLIDRDEAREAHTLMAGPEHMSGALGVDGHGVKNGVCHLGGQEPAPDQLIKLILVGVQAALHPLRLQLHMGWTNGLVGVLGTGLGLELMMSAVIILASVPAADKIRSGIHGFLGKPQRIGTHIGDQACGALSGDLHAFIELLGHHHGLLGGEAQLPGGLLLQSRSSKGRGGGTLLLRLLHVGDGEFLPGNVPDDTIGLLFVFQLPLFGAAVVMGHKGAGLAHPVQGHVQRPVLLGLEGTDLVLPIHHHPGSHGLDTTGGQPPAYLLPQQRRQLIANDSVQNAAGLLGVHQIIVNVPGMLDRILHYLLRNFVKRDPLSLPVRQIQKLLQMPGNGLSLPVRVGRQVHGVRLGGVRLQLLDESFLAPDGDILGGEIVLQVYAHFALGQIPQVSHTGLDGISGTQIPSDGLCFRGGLHDHKIVRLSHMIKILRFVYWNCSLGSSDEIGKSWQREILFPGKVWKMEEYFVYPQGVCHIRKSAYAGNGCAIFPIFQTADWGQKIRCPAADDLFRVSYAT